VDISNTYTRRRRKHLKINHYRVLSLSSTVMTSLCGIIPQIIANGLLCRTLLPRCTRKLRLYYARRSFVPCSRSAVRRLKNGLCCFQRWTSRPFGILRDGYLHSSYPSSKIWAGCSNCHLEGSLQHGLFTIITAHGFATVLYLHIYPIPNYLNNLRNANSICLPPRLPLRLPSNGAKPLYAQPPR
jgi:hypothetical protein